MNHKEKWVATYTSVLAWEIPWIEEPGRLQSVGSQRVRHDLATKQKQLNYSVVLMSTVQQTDYTSIQHIHTFLFLLFSIMVYHWILNIVPHAVQ